MPDSKGLCTPSAARLSQTESGRSAAFRPHLTVCLALSERDYVAIVSAIEFPLPVCPPPHLRRRRVCNGPQPKWTKSAEARPISGRKHSPKSATPPWSKPERTLSVLAGARSHAWCSLRGDDGLSASTVHLFSALLPSTRFLYRTIYGVPELSENQESLPRANGIRAAHSTPPPRRSCAAPRCRAGTVHTYIAVIAARRGTKQQEGCRADFHPRGQLFPRTHR
jgi:hypothetical protein